MPRMLYPTPAMDAGDSHTGRVLAIASHVVSGYVGNSITTFVLQLLGLEAATLNTVQFSNHAGYRQLKGFRTSAAQIEELWEGLKLSGLHEFDMMLTGYVPGAEQLEVVGKIGQEAKAQRSCFWLLDPVMGDRGRLYVSEAVVPVYKSLVSRADMIVPNQFEAELLCGVKVDSLLTLSKAIDELHSLYHIPHIVITSVTFNGGQKMKCAGSTITSSHGSRKFVFDVPIIDGFYSGTGDLFAALTLARLHQQSSVSNLLDVKSWLPPDNIAALDLPLAKAVAAVLASVHSVIARTKNARDMELESLKKRLDDAEDGQAVHVLTTKASELRLVQSHQELLSPSLPYAVMALE